MNTIQNPHVDAYLRSKYAGVFSEAAITNHLRDYVGMEYASQMINWVLQEYPHPEKILDIGSGFGSFVLLCRKNDIDAVGIELSDFEVNFARERLMNQCPQDDPKRIYLNGDALHIPFPDQSFGAVTLFNVMEHINDTKALLTEVNRVLKTGGHLFVVCPNYAAFRKEAHYHIPWIPGLPRSFAQYYIHLFGKNPQFFEESIFCTTHLGVLHALSKGGFRIFHDAHEDFKEKLTDLDSIRIHKIRMIAKLCKKYHMLWLISLLIRASVLKNKIFFLNPIRDSTIVHAVKN